MTQTLFQFALIALGGAFGGIGRVFVASVIERRFGDRFPWGTLAVNVSGSAVIGLAATLPVGGAAILADPAIRALVIIGFIGSYTTVSTFALQTYALGESGRWGVMATNMALSVSLCLIAAAAGATIGAAV